MRQICGRESAANCPLCENVATQAHINIVCSHPARMDQRQLLKRDIELHFLSFRHTVLPPAQRWISLLMQYAETHLWEDSETAGNIWNGRWSRQIIRNILSEHRQVAQEPRHYSRPGTSPTHDVYARQRDCPDKLVDVI